MVTKMNRDKRQRLFLVSVRQILVVRLQVLRIRDGKVSDVAVDAPS